MSKGYLAVYAPDHPRAKSRPYVYEHILVAEETIGRFLTRTEVVHHVDGDKANNDPGNLVVCANQAEHMRIHAEQALGEAYQAGNERGLVAV